MKKHHLFICLALFTILMPNKGAAQFLMDMVDTTKDAGKGLLSIYKKYDHLKIGGYIQPQFQLAAEKGIKSFEGGDFGTQVSNRFMLRRSRVRIDYVHFGQSKDPGVQIVFQFDANERGFTVRDVWGRVFDNKTKLFSFTTGMFARPFGHEVNYSSSDRETPERGRMSQLLMKSERDLGAMVSFDPRRNIPGLNKVKLDLAVFNGQGINATGDFDNSKDLVIRLSSKPIKISKATQLTFGASTLQGGLMQNTKYKYYTGSINGIKTTLVDTSAQNLWADAPRKYYGVDVQVKIKNKVGFTELRAELAGGQQSASANNSETPVTLLSGTDGLHVRNFNGAYFYYVQTLFTLKHQLVVKYDWYDPNTKVTGKEIGAQGSNFSAANIKYTTLGMGYVNNMTENIKLVVYYAKVWNETTQLNGYISDIKDNVLTLRMQFRF
jgi:hypothetical protein